MASSPVSEPVVVLYKSSACRHCTALSNIWDKPPSKDQDSVMTALKKVYPNLRFYVVTAKDNTGKFDENTAPKDLIRYAKWFPNILLIPGQLWDAAMAKLGPKNDVMLIDGVQIMNGRLVNGVPNYEQLYDIRKPSEFANWLKVSLENEDFRRVQSKSGGSGIIVPTTQTPSQPIQPLLTSIMRPANTSNNYAVAGVVDSHGTGHTSDICAMRIISRPK